MRSSDLPVHPNMVGLLAIPRNLGPYGMRKFDVADLDGNMIFFGMELKRS
jgi:hypothetical protein